MATYILLNVNSLKQKIASPAEYLTNINPVTICLRRLYEQRRAMRSDAHTLSFLKELN